MQTLAILVVLVAAIALWARRWTFNCNYERSVSANILVLAASVTLRGPLFPEVAHRWLYQLTGAYNLERLLGAVLALVGMAIALYTFLVRYGDECERQLLITRWVTLPLTVTIPLMLALFWSSSWARNSASASTTGGHILTAPQDGWLLSYFFIWSMQVIAILWAAAGLLRRIRRDNGRSLPSDLYAVWVCAGWATAGVLIVGIAASINASTLAWSIEALGSILWSVAATHSWRRRSRPLRIAHPDEIRKKLL